MNPYIGLHALSFFLLTATVTTIQLAGAVDKNLSYGVSYMVAYMALDDSEPKRTCFQVNGTNTSAVAIQAVLPDLTGFKV